MKERGHLESLGRGVCWQCSLAKLKQLAVASAAWRREPSFGGGRERTTKAAWRKFSSVELVISFILKHKMLPR